MSDDGRFTVVAIVLLGNPFSPSYARARARGGPARALDHTAVHVAIEGPGGARRWALTERRAGDGALSPEAAAIGASRAEWRGGSLVLTLDERTTPGASPVRGTIRVDPETRPFDPVQLEPCGRHSWWPVAPVARVTVDLVEPALRFQGHGYHDVNAGGEPLDVAFRRWSWARARPARGRALVMYDVLGAAGRVTRQSLAFDGAGVTPFEAGVRGELPGTRWGLNRAAPADPGFAPRIVRTLEDGPCYARSLVATHWRGERVFAVHEVLSAERLARRWVTFLLSFRVSRGR